AVREQTGANGNCRPDEAQAQGRIGKEESLTFLVLRLLPSHKSCSSHLQNDTFPPETESAFGHPFGQRPERRIL
ncbi:MAG: hypothetical protein ACYSUB_16110, partial [Planctomycetota bacterium]